MKTSGFLNHVPDLILIFSITLSILLDRALPVIQLIPFPFSLVGWLIILWAIGLVLASIRSLRESNTSTDPLGTPSALITSGPFAFSRNPLYLAYFLTMLGTAFVLGSFSAFIPPLLGFLLLDKWIIPIEESTMAATFGATYEAYRQKTRRWV